MDDNSVNAMVASDSSGSSSVNAPAGSDPGSADTPTASSSGSHSIPDTQRSINAPAGSDPEGISGSGSVSQPSREEDEEVGEQAEEAAPIDFADPIPECPKCGDIVCEQRQSVLHGTCYGGVVAREEQPVVEAAGMKEEAAAPIDYADPIYECPNCGKIVREQCEFVLHGFTCQGGGSGTGGTAGSGGCRGCRNEGGGGGRRRR